MKLIHQFFIYCFMTQQSFYWEWNAFMVRVRFSSKKKHAVMAIDIPIKDAPYVKQERLYFSPPYHDMEAVFFYLYDHFPSSEHTIRNQQVSRRGVLSYRSFLEKVSENEIDLTLLPSIKSSSSRWKKKQNNIKKLLQEKNVYETIGSK